MRTLSEMPDSDASNGVVPVSGVSAGYRVQLVAESPRDGETRAVAPGQRHGQPARRQDD